jgi:tRNA threonylcarbamoyladenosine biosynthesis protein TsaB
VPPFDASATFHATILLVDTATEDCRVALCRAAMPRTAAAVRVEAVGQGHSQRVLPMVDALLREHNLRPGDCDAFAFGAGPGAFTGLRIACGLVQGLAFASGRPVVGVCTLRALAVAGAGEAADERVLVAIDARMQQLYWAVYERDAGAAGWRERAPPALAGAGELPALCARWQPTRLVGNAVGAPGLGREFADLPRSVPVPATLASVQLQLAHDDYRAGRALAPALATPLYVRDRVALTVAERQALAETAGARP